MFRKEQSETTNDPDGEKRHDDLEGPEIGETAISNLGGGGGVEIPHDAEIRFSVVNMVRRTRNSAVCVGGGSSVVSNIRISRIRGCARANLEE